MKRDLRKAIAEYDKKFLHRNDNAGAFYVSDIYQIKEISGGGTMQTRFTMRLVTA